MAKQMKSKQSRPKRVFGGNRDLKMSGRIRPLGIALIVLIAGLLLDKWWWQLGIVIMIALFIDAYNRYRTLN